MAIQLHADLLSIPSIRSSIIDSLSLSLLPGTQNRDVLGSWLVAALEEGRRAGGIGLKTWESCTSFVLHEGRIDLSAQISTLIEYLSLSILDPHSLHDDIHPAPVSSATTSAAPIRSAKGGKGKVPPSLATTSSPAGAAEDEEVAEERWARYRVGGLTGLAWLIHSIKSIHPAPPAELLTLFRTPLLWTALSPLAPTEDTQVLGWQQSPVRRAAYTLLTALVETYPEVLDSKDLQDMLAVGVLGSCWTEREATVWETAGPAVVKFLNSKRDGCSPPLMLQSVQYPGRVLQI
jgi:hypothetical protein